MLRRRLALLPTLALLALAPALAACGGDDGADAEAEVRETLTALAQAIAQKDYQRICDRIFAPELVQKVEGVLPCEVTLSRSVWATSQRPALTVQGVTIQGESATARIRTSAADQPPSDDTAKLVKRDGAWRVIALAS